MKEKKLKKKVATSAEIRLALATELLNEMRSVTSKLSILVSAMLARMAADDRYFNENRNVLIAKKGPKPPRKRARKVRPPKVRTAGGN